MDEVMITVPLKVFVEAVDDQDFLYCLYECGLDTWSKFDDALEMYHELYGENGENDESNLPIDPE